MCELCSKDPQVRRNALDAHELFAARLARLARFYDRVSQGRIKPHTEEWKEMRGDMRQVTREFLEVLL